MRRALAMVLLAGAGCAGNDSALVLEIARAKTLDIKPDSLSFVIGARLGDRYVRDATSSIDVSVSGRDLAGDPYRLYLTDERADAQKTPILAFVIARRGAEVVGSASLGPMSFDQGSVLIHRAELDVTTEVLEGPGDCARLTRAGSPTVIVSPADLDCDGLGPAGGDCDDLNPLIRPGADEVCDGKDNDCDGRCDGGLDGDGDGVTPCGSHPLGDGRCGAPGPADCDDADAAIVPGAVDVCDGKDNDCDGVCDGRIDDDHDRDGYTSCGTLAAEPVGARHAVCGAPVADLADCRDDDPDVHPFAHELCDGKDDDCDGARLTSARCFTRAAGPTAACDLGTRVCDDDARDGASGLAPGCTPDAAEIRVAGEACDAYQSAACAAAADPFRCAVAAAAPVTLDCLASMRVTPGGAGAATSAELCPGGSVRLPATSGGPSCVYSLVGGIDQDGVRAGFGSAGSLKPTLAACSADLLVTALESRYGPVADELLVLATGAGGVSALTRVTVTPRQVASCPPSPLACTMRGQ